MHTVPKATSKTVRPTHRGITTAPLPNWIRKVSTVAWPRARRTKSNVLSHTPSSFHNPLVASSHPASINSSSTCKSWSLDLHSSSSARNSIRKVWSTDEISEWQTKLTENRMYYIPFYSQIAAATSRGIDDDDCLHVICQHNLFSVIRVDVERLLWWLLRCWI